MLHPIEFPKPELNYLMSVDLTVSESYDLGTKIIETIHGGTITGKLKGILHSGSGHWNTGNQIDGKYILETAEKKIIPIDVQGTSIDGKLQLRLFFHTGEKEYAWLNHVIVIGVGKVSDGHYRFDCYTLGDHPDGDHAESFFPTPSLEHLYYVNVEVSEFLQAGKLPEGSHMVIPITGGRFEGKRLNGTVENLGADWNFLRQSIPVTSHVSTRYLLKTDDSAYLSLFTDGRMKMGLDGIMAFAKKKPDPLKCYFKQHLMFTTGDPRYAWLNDALCVATVANTPEMQVCYDAYQVIFEPRED